ncbi:hypothetical protein KFL_005170100 [Klebsormidium nitens]|uniref:Uncharacterized protein n=1 Tax=Klebsormidium nitens TaxID=105231 RepID=A0A1Y1IES4_KLENI|nr:hypothetical protein KFL_005170100 [Klebsormidium nitens]|eukprot:GAQ89400.1 hypothetical protein KFL_005170100 [Klebsormidium nitens]
MMLAVGRRYRSFAILAEKRFQEAQQQIADFMMEWVGPGVRVERTPGGLHDHQLRPPFPLLPWEESGVARGLLAAGRTLERRKNDRAGEQLSSGGRRLGEMFSPLAQYRGRCSPPARYRGRHSPAPEKNLVSPPEGERGGGRRVGRKPILL